MTAQLALRNALRERLGPAARAHGFKGSAPTWRKASDAGDWAVVNVQSSLGSTSNSLRCVLNLAFAPEPWLRWQQERLGAGMPKAVTEALGLYRERLHPEGTPEGVDGWWQVSDEGSASAAVLDMNVQLERAGWPVLSQLFSRESMLARLRQGDLGRVRRSNFGVFFAMAEALMLMDQGPSDELESALGSALDNCLPRQRANAEHFDRWVRTEAAKA